MKNFKTLIVTLLVALMALTPVISLADIQLADPYTWEIPQLTLTEGHASALKTGNGLQSGWTDFQTYLSNDWQMFRNPNGLTLEPKSITVSDAEENTYKKYAVSSVVNSVVYMSINHNRRPGYSANKLAVEFDLKITNFADDSIIYEVTDPGDGSEFTYDYTDGTKYYKKALPYKRYKTSSDYVNYATGATSTEPAKSTGNSELDIDAITSINSSGSEISTLRFYVQPADNNYNSLVFGLRVSNVSSTWIRTQGSAGYEFNAKNWYRVRIAADVDTKEISLKVVNLGENKTSNAVVVDAIYNCNGTSSSTDINKKAHANEAASVTGFFNNAVALQPYTKIISVFSAGTTTVNNVKYTVEKFDVNTTDITSNTGTFDATVKVAHNLVANTDNKIAITDTTAPKIIMAAYDADGKLVNVAFYGEDEMPAARGTYKSVLADSNYNTYNVSVNKVSSTGATATKAKLFVWKNAENMIPLTDAVSYGFGN